MHIYALPYIYLYVYMDIPVCLQLYIFVHEMKGKNQSVTNLCVPLELYFILDFVILFRGWYSHKSLCLYNSSYNLQAKRWEERRFCSKSQLCSLEMKCPDVLYSARTHDLYLFSANIFSHGGLKIGQPWTLNNGLGRVLTSFSHSKFGPLL